MFLFFILEKLFSLYEKIKPMTINNYSDRVIYEKRFQKNFHLGVKPVGS